MPGLGAIDRRIMQPKLRVLPDKYNYQFLMTFYVMPLPTEIVFRERALKAQSF
jgi:hypothetical protein